jgi:gamma-glutamyltranspeptidase/glutathione hydrolase
MTMAATGTIAGGSELTVEAGAEVLRAGGNATDAAVAAVLAAFHVEPLLASAAGGGVALVGSVGDGFDVLNFVPSMPGLSSETLSQLDFRSVWIDFGVTEQEFHIGRGAAAVPGGIVGLFETHRRGGRLPLQDVVAPAVRFCREGFVANTACESFISMLEPIWRSSPGATGLYVRANGDRAVAGDRLMNPEFADTLMRLAREGVEPFVRGDIAERTVTAFGPKVGGLITAEDLRAFTPIVQRPLEVAAFGGTVLTPPPPSTGGTLIGLALGVASIHRGERAAPTFSSLARVKEAVDLQLLSTALRHETVEQEEFDEAQARAVIDPFFLAEHASRLGSIGPGGNALRSGPGNTTHVSVIDGEGGAASITVSNGEGCGYLIPGTGMHMNNFLGEDDINPSGFHQLPAGSRMATMMSPTIFVRDGHPVLALGSGGSNRLRTAILQVAMNVLDQDMALGEAVDASRIHAEPDRFFAEVVESEALADAFRVISEPFEERELFPGRSLYFGGVHAVGWRADGRLVGYGDPRRGGASRTVEGA